MASQGALPEEKMVSFEAFLPVPDGKWSCLGFVQIVHTKNARTHSLGRLFSTNKQLQAAWLETRLFHFDVEREIIILGMH